MGTKTLTNFIVPDHIKSRFDEVCRASGRTRTSVLVEMMENYTLSQGRILADRNEEFEKVDQTLEKSRRMMGFKEFLAHEARKEEIARQNRSYSSFDLPSPMMSDGRDEW